MCGEAVLHDCLPRLETIYGFDSRGSSDVRVTSLLMLSDTRIFRQFGSLPKRQQPKRRTNEKAITGWGAQLNRGAQVRDAHGALAYLSPNFLLHQVKTFSSKASKVWSFDFPENVSLFSLAMVLYTV